MTTTTEGMVELCKDTWRYERVVNFTTRKMRRKERQGDPYIFVDEDIFSALLATGMLLESDPTQNAKRYGTPAAPYLRAQQGGLILFVHVNYMGIDALIKLFGEQVRVIWLDISKKTSALRFKQRCLEDGSEFSEQTLVERMEQADVEIAWMQRRSQELGPDQFRIVNGEQRRPAVLEQSYILSQITFPPEARIAA